MATFDGADVWFASVDSIEWPSLASGRLQTFLNVFSRIHK